MFEKQSNSHYKPEHGSHWGELNTYMSTSKESVALCLNPEDEHTGIHI